MSSLSKKTILVAEDHEDSLQMIRNFLEFRGYDVIEARDGVQAVELACSEIPDLILMDLNIPKLGGIDASQQIRRCEKLSDVPSLTNSSSGAQGIELFLNIEKLGDGIMDYIPKPFNLDHLSEMIEAILRKTEKSGIANLPN